LTKNPYLSFFEHLEELRKRLLISLAAVGVASVGGYLASGPAVEFLTAPLRSEAGAVYFFSPQGAFTVKLKASLLLGALAASPVVLHQFWSFVSPALYPRERRAVVPLAAVTSALFVTGAVFAYLVVLPAAMKFLLGMQTGSLKPMISVEEYLSFVTMLVLSFGVAFNLPVFVLALVGAGITDAAGLNRFQRHAIVAIFIAAAVLTPGPDIASQLLLALPLLVLFEISVLIAVFIGRRAHSARGGVR